MFLPANPNPLLIKPQQGYWATSSLRLWCGRWWQTQATRPRTWLMTGAMLAIFCRLSLLTAGLESLIQFLKRTRNSSGNGSLKNLFRSWKKTANVFSEYRPMHSLYYRHKNADILSETGIQGTLQLPALQHVPTCILCTCHHTANGTGTFFFND